MISFEQLGLSKQVLASLDEVGFTEPTEIQEKTIGIVTQRRDLIASAQTGSGKTAAYVLPIIDLLRSGEKTLKTRTRALIIVPTRELALQVKSEFERFSKDSGLKAVCLYGGVGYRQQVQGLHRGADVIVATPGRLLDCANRNFAQLSRVQVLVLDEADRLLDMGFMPQVRAVVDRIPKERQTLMFSATIDARMKKIAEEFLINPAVVTANKQKIEPSSIEQKFHYIKEAEKESMLLEILDDKEIGSVLVFTRTKRKAAQVTKRLQVLDVQAAEIHGDISQGQRSRTLDSFRRGEFTVLVATDVAARGLDVPSISHVINYDLPMLAEDYVHRIGRTGRAGRSGIAHSFVSNDQKHLIHGIQMIMKNKSGEKPAEAGKKVSRKEQEARTYAAHLATGRSAATPHARKPQSRKPAYGAQRQDERSYQGYDSYSPRPESREKQGYEGTQSRSEGRAKRSYESSTARPEGRAQYGYEAAPSRPEGREKRSYEPTLARPDGRAKRSYEAYSPRPEGKAAASQHRFKRSKQVATRRDRAI